MKVHPFRVIIAILALGAADSLMIGFSDPASRSAKAAQNTTELPSGRPEATIDLATEQGAKLVKGEWRYSDTRIVETDFRAPGPDKQPTGKPIKTYDYERKAGPADF